MEQEGRLSKRRYSNVRVLTDVRVMSDGHYWLTVIMDGGPRRSYSPTFGFEGRGWYPTWEGPQYLIAETDRLIAEGCRNGTFRFYEHDQEGQRRYDGLRYHDPEQIAWWGETLGGTG